MVPRHTQPTLPLECHCRVEYSASFLQPFCPLPVQRKFEITELSASRNYFGTYRWPLGANGPPPLRVSLLEWILYSVFEAPLLTTCTKEIRDNRFERHMEWQLTYLWPLSTHSPAQQVGFHPNGFRVCPYTFGLGPQELAWRPHKFVPP